MAPTTDDVAERLLGSLLGCVEVMSVHLGDRLGLVPLAGHRRSGHRARAGRAHRHPSALRPRVAGAAGRGRAARGRADGARRRASSSPSPPRTPRCSPTRAAWPTWRRSRGCSEPSDPRSRSSSRPTATAAASAGTTSVTTPASARPTPTGRGTSTSSPERSPACPRCTTPLGRRGPGPRRRAAAVAGRRIALARAYPSARCSGVDIDAALGRDGDRERRRRPGVADRVTLHAPATLPSLAEATYDVAFAFECVHDMPRPVDVLARGPPGAHAGRRDGGDGRGRRGRVRRRTATSSSGSCTASACSSACPTRCRRRPASAPAP